MVRFEVRGKKPEGAPKATAPSNVNGDPGRKERAQEAGVFLMSLLVFYDVPLVPASILRQRRILFRATVNTVA